MCFFGFFGHFDEFFGRKGSFAARHKRAKEHPTELREAHAVGSSFLLRQYLERRADVEFDEVGFSEGRSFHMYLFYTILGTCQARAYQQPEEFNQS